MTKTPSSPPNVRLLFLPVLTLLALGITACGPSTGEPIADAADSIEAETARTKVFVREAAVLESADPEFDAIFPAGSELEVLAEGFTWSEGPVWVPGGDFLLFSDVPGDVVFRWDEEHGLSPWIQPSGHTGRAERSREPGANGLYLDADGRLLLCQHGDRRLARLDADVQDGPFLERSAPFVTLADHFDGKRFNSPNDLVVHPSGAIYFTDPPYGLVDETFRELPHHGVYRITPGESGTEGTGADLLHAELSRPNGIALSPDGGTLYVANSDPESALWMRWPLLADSGLGEGSVLHDATSAVSDERPGLPDGMAVDNQGRLFATGPGGLWVFGFDGRHLGILRLPHATANVTFGEDGKTLFLTSHHRLLRLRVETTGLGFAEQAPSTHTSLAGRQ